MARYSITDYGASESSDSTTAVINTITAAGVAGGGEVYVPEGEFPINTRQGSGGVYWCLPITYDNVHIWGPGKLTFNPAAGPALCFWPAGSGKKSRVADGVLTNWYLYWLWEFGDVQYTTLYNLAAGIYSKDDNVVTLNTHSDASHFSVGDWIGIRTGETGGTTHGTPDGELQQVLTANASTGVIEVTDNLKTDYAKEYFITGTSGATSTSVTANGAYFAAANATDKLLHNVTIGPLTIEQQTAQFVVGGDQTIGLTLQDLTIQTSTYGLNGAGRSKDQTVTDCTINITNGSGAGGADYWIAADSTCTDFLWENIVMTSDYPKGLHLNEGCGRITARDLDVTTAAVRGEHYLARSSGRSYDIDIDGGSYRGGADYALFYIDTTNRGQGILSGHIHDVTFDSPLGTTPVAIGPTAASGWVYEPKMGVEIPVFAQAAGRSQ